MSKALVQPCLIRLRTRSAYDVDTFTWLFGYLYYRFKDKRIRILFILFSLLSCILVYPKEVQQQDTYKITEIKKGYYIGKNRGSKILIQTDLDLSFQDEVKVKHIEPIHTDDNFTLFSFTKYNENKNSTTI